MDRVLNVAVPNSVMALALALLALAIGAALRRPALTHALWLLVLLRLLVPSVWRIEVPWPAPAVPETVTEPAVAVAPPAPAPVEPTKEPAPVVPAAWFEFSPVVGPDVAPVAAPPPAPVEEAPPAPPPAVVWSWPEVAATVWAIGSALMLLLTAHRLWRFQAELRAYGRSRDALAHRIQRQADRVARRLGLARSPAVWLVPGRLSPMLWAGLGRPRLVLPRGLVERLDGQRRSALLAHELAHLRRGDHWVRRFEMVVGILYWWHPLVWLARRQLREAEEQCCDAWVVWSLPAARHAYATSLVDAVDFLSGPRCRVPAAASGVGPVRQLRRRLIMILQGATHRRLSLGGCLAVGAVGVALLSFSPSFGQPPTPPPPPGAGEQQADQPGRPGPRDQDEQRLNDQRRRAEEQLRAAREQLEKAAAQMRAAEERLRAAESRRRTEERREQRDREKSDRRGAGERGGPGFGAAPPGMRPGMPGMGKMPGGGMAMGGMGMGGGFGMGPAAVSPMELFDLLARGSDTINRSRLDPKSREIFERLAQRMELKGDHVTRQQFEDALKRRPGGFGMGGMMGGRGRGGFGGARGGPPGQPGGPGAGGQGGPPGANIPGLGGPRGPGGSGGGVGAPGMPMPGSGMPPSAMGPGGGDASNRVRNLERQLNDLRRELNDLRREMRRSGDRPRPEPRRPGGRPEANGAPPATPAPPAPPARPRNTPAPEVSAPPR